MYYTKLLSLFLWQLLWLLPITATAQTIVVKGKIIDATTQQPLPYANVGVAGTNLGTSANADGVFRLVLSGSRLPAMLNVSYLGYGVGRQRVTGQIESLRIALQPTDKNLREVVVMPDSSLRVLLRKAYNRISDNYSNKPSRLTFFYREAIKSLRDEYVYFGEALMRGRVEGYQNTREEGQIEVLQSRVRHFAGFDTVNHSQFYGGAFSFVNGDRVKRRASVIEPNFKKYDYRLDEMTELDERPVYVIGYEEKKVDENPTKGRFYIDQQTLAYIAFEWESKPRSSGSTIVRGVSTNKVFYKRAGSTWQLQRIESEEDFIDKTTKRTLRIALELLVTDIDTVNADPIPFDKRMPYATVFSKLKSNDTTAFWANQTILEPTQPLIASMQTTAKQSDTNPKLLNQPTTVSRGQRWGEKAFNILRRVEFRGFPMPRNVPYSSVTSGMRLNWPGGPGGSSYNQEGSQAVFPMGLATGYGFTIGNRWLVSSSGGASVQSKVQWKQRSWSVSYALLLKTSGNPLIMRPAVGYYRQKLNMDLYAFTNPDRTFQLDGARLKAQNLMLGTGERNQGLRYSLRFDYKLRKFKWLFADIGFYQPLSRQLRVTVREKSGFFLFRSEASTPLNRVNASLLFDNKPIVNLPNFRPFFGEIGLRWTFL